jgi:hypothetical protein
MIATKTPGFGHKGCVDPRGLARMPEHLQREGLLLLREMGMNMLVAASAAGLGPIEAEAIIAGKRFSLEGEWGI